MLQRNASAHDQLANVYDEKHSEIYNPVEQARLDEAISDVLGRVSASAPAVLDFGAGTGNLTLKFLARGCRVTAADVSARSLDRLVRKAQAHGTVSSVLLDGDRIPFPDASFDVVATYSVLHHVPDYLLAVREMARVLRPDGILYIDHESNEAAWRGESTLAEYRDRTRLSVAAHVAQLIRTRELFTFSFAKTVFMKALVNRRYEREGDIHVWSDDHIEWDRVIAVLDEAGASIVVSRDYLLYQPRGGLPLYRRYRDLCTDTRYVIARKRG
ncbi:MAG: class I SAM-dependent methyltransferase [Thermoanaerobaculia bacterium]